jgi:hypothetical protein
MWLRRSAPRLYRKKKEMKIIITDRHRDALFRHSTGHLSIMVVVPKFFVSTVTSATSVTTLYSKGLSV